MFSLVGTTRTCCRAPYRLVDVIRNVRSKEFLSYCVVHAPLALVSYKWLIVPRMESTLSKGCQHHFLRTVVELWCSALASVVVNLKFWSTHSGMLRCLATIAVFCQFVGEFFAFWYFSFRPFSYRRLYRTNFCLILSNRVFVALTPSHVVLNVAFLWNVYVGTLFIRHLYVLNVVT